MKYNEVIKASRVKWNNMVEKGKDKIVNPSDAKILALTTKVGQLEKALAEKRPAPDPVAAAKTAKHPKTGRNVFPGQHQIEKWRGKKEGDEKVVDGRTYYWCPHHKYEGHYDGLYVSSHKASEHDIWKKNGKQSRNRWNKEASSGNAGSANGGGTSNPSNKSKLVLNDRIKSVLTTKLMLNDDDVEQICKEINQGN